MKQGCFVSVSFFFHAVRNDNPDVYYKCSHYATTLWPNDDGDTDESTYRN